jgi:flagellar biosynthesis/type III secretory pathway protein FliH
MDEIEALLRQRITEYIDGRFLSKEELDLLFASARGDRDAANQLKNALTNKKDEFEQRAKSAADSAIQQGKDEAAKQAEQAIQNVLPGGIKLPGF